VSDQTTITVDLDHTFSTDELNGALLRVATSTGLAYARVLDTTATTIVIDDFGGSYADLIWSGSAGLRGFTVLEFNDSSVTNAPAYHTSGNWTAAPSYNGGTNETTFTDSAAAFADYQVGWPIALDAGSMVYRTIISRTATTIVVAGDATGIAANADLYLIYTPVGLENTYGATNESLCASGPKYLFAEYRYITPPRRLLRLGRCFRPRR